MGGSGGSSVSDGAGILEVVLLEGLSLGGWTDVRPQKGGGEGGGGDNVLNRHRG